jgi:hypothetical protein
VVLTFGKNIAIIALGIRKGKKKKSKMQIVDENICNQMPILNLNDRERQGPAVPR